MRLFALKQLLTLAMSTAPLTVAVAAPSELVDVDGATYQPFYPAPDDQPVTVADFELEVTPVTNAQFAEFVAQNPRWIRGQVAPIFADVGYLSHWLTSTSPDPVDVNRPVTHVSWFAASAYCRAIGRRLPTEAEWELAARADATRADASDDPAFTQQILDWYAAAPNTLPEVTTVGTPNVWGVWGLHGVTWEWVADFNASMVSADNRQLGDEQMGRFCGGASATAADVRDYATFMRYAFRTSLHSNYTVANLGFRCASDR